MKLFDYDLISGFLVKDGKVLAYSLSFNKEDLIKHLSKINSFHGLNAEMVFDRGLDKYFEEKINEFFRFRRNPLDIDIRKYKYYEVYEELLRISFGKTVSYSELYKRVGRYKFFEVIRALIYNPFIIFIPCHRVIRKDGKIGGYTPLGKKFKEKILRFERMMKDHRDEG